MDPPSMKQRETSEGCTIVLYDIMELAPITSYVKDQKMI